MTSVVPAADPTAPDSATRRWRVRLAVAGLVVLLLLALWGLAGRAAGVTGAPPRTVSIAPFVVGWTSTPWDPATPEDFDPGVLVTLHEALREIEFPRPVDLLVVFTNVVDLGRDAESADALPASALATIELSHPELLSEDGTELAPQTLALAIDPGAGLTAALAGPGLGLTPEDTERIAASLSPGTAGTSWIGAPTVGAAAAAQIMSPSWQRSVLLVLLAVVLVLLALGAVVVLRSRSGVGARTARLR